MRVILTFYQNFAVISVFISLLSCYLLLYSGSPYFIIHIFWIKLISTSGLLAYMHIFRSAQFNFFYNLGYSPLQLYSMSTLVDFGICSQLIFITLKLL